LAFLRLTMFYFSIDLTRALLGCPPILIST
jgi:hypothetical protein